MARNINPTKLSLALMALLCSLPVAPAFAQDPALDAMQEVDTALYDTDDDAGIDAADLLSDEELEDLESGSAAQAAPQNSSTTATGDNSSDDAVYDLGQSVVTAAGFAQDLREAPASMSVITSEEINETPARDLGDIVADLPGVEITKSKTGGSQVGIRGFSSAYTLYMVDGKRQNSSQAFVVNGFDPNFGFTPPSSMIERVEVIRGPASTLYGSDAIGGAINVITKRHPDRITGSLGFDTQIQEHSKFGHAYGTNGMIAVPVWDNQLSFMLRGRYYTKDNTELLNPDGSYVTHSANEYTLKNYGAKVTYSPTKDHHISLDAEQYKQRAGSMSTSSTNETSLTEYTKDQAILNYDGEFDFGTLNTYLQYYKHSTDDTYEFYNEAYIVESRLVTPFDLSSINANLGLLNLTYGVQFWHDRFRDDSALDSGQQVDIAGSDLLHNLTSAYLEGEYFINDNWIATLGGRYTYSDIFGSHVTPRAYLVFKANDELSFKAGVAAGYRVPTAKELADGVYQQNSKGANPRYGNSDLEPETSVNYELGVMYEKARLGSVSLTAFLTDFKNTLGYDDYAVGQTMSNGEICNPSLNNNSAYCSIRDNVGKTRAQGVELLFKTAKFYNFSLSGSYTYTQQEYREGADKGKDVNAIPHHSIMTKLSFDKNNYGFFVKGVAKYDTPYVSSGKTDPSFTQYEDYILVDIGGHYNFTPNSRLNVTINNLFDLDAYDSFDAVQGSKGTTYTPYYRDYIEGRNLYINYVYEF